MKHPENNSYSENTSKIFMPGKHLWQIPCLAKALDLQPEVLEKKNPVAGVFLVISRSAQILSEHIWMITSIAIRQFLCKLKI